MLSVTIAAIVFLCLAGTTLLALLAQSILPDRHLTKETQDVVKLGVGMIIAMTALILGLQTSSVKGNFDAVSGNVKSFAGEILLLDGTLTLYGPEALAARQHLAAYTREAYAETWPKNGSAPLVDSGRSAATMAQVENDVVSLKPSDHRQELLAWQAVKQVMAVASRRWTIIEQYGTSINRPMMIALVVWLSIVFASFGYNAPRNVFVVVSLLVCAASIAGAIFLIAEFDSPFSGIIKVKSRPMAAAITHLYQPPAP